MAPAVGAKVFTVRAAVIIGGIITIVGAATLGSNVSEKVGSDMVSGMDMSIDMVFAILISMAIWLLIASISKGLPISTTQCIVGSVIGVAVSAPLMGYSDWGVGVVDWFVVLQVFAAAAARFHQYALGSYAVADVGNVLFENSDLGASGVILRCAANVVEQLRASFVIKEFRRNAAGGLAQSSQYFIVKIGLNRMKVIKRYTGGILHDY